MLDDIRWLLHKDGHLTLQACDENWQWFDVPMVQEWPNEEAPIRDNRIPEFWPGQGIVVPGQIPDEEIKAIRALTEKIRSMSPKQAAALREALATEPP